MNRSLWTIHRTIGCGLAAILVSACSSPEPGAPPAPRRLVLSNVHVAGYPTAEALVGLAEAVGSDPLLAGRIEVDLQLGGVLGNEKETLEKLAFGGIQMACTSAAPLAEFSSEIGVLTLPYLFADRDEMWSVLEGPIGERLLESLADAGFVGLAWYDAGARSFYNRERPVRDLADLAGLKIRVQKSEIMRSTAAALGATPVSLGFKQVYTSLTTGNIDGAENNLPSFLSERHFEAAKFYSFDRHTMIPDLVLMNRTAWQELSPEEQTALREAARGSAARQRELWRDYSESARTELEAAGVTFHEIEDLAPFHQAVAEVYAEHAPEYADWISEIRALRGEMSE